MTTPTKQKQSLRGTYAMDMDDGHSENVPQPQPRLQLQPRSQNQSTSFSVRHVKWSDQLNGGESGSGSGSASSPGPNPGPGPDQTIPYTESITRSWSSNSSNSSDDQEDTKSITEPLNLINTETILLSMEELNLVPFDDKFFLFPEEKENDDYLHDPDDNLNLNGRSRICAGCCCCEVFNSRATNWVSLVGLFLGLLMLFVGWPAL